MVLVSITAACAPDPPSAIVGVVVDGCDPGDEVGSGVVVGDTGLILTAAHVLAGAEAIEVRRGDRRSPGRVVAFDPEMDLAYLATELPNVAGLPLTSDGVEGVDAGDGGVAYVVRSGEVVAVPVRVRRRVQIRTEDIYVQGETLRPGLELDADIRAGDSGAAVVVDGEVVGVIWARSRRFEDRAYAIDPVRAGALIERQLATGELGPNIDLTRCH